MTKRVRIAAVQFEHRPVSSFDQFAAQVRHHVQFAADSGCHLVVFPEYLTGPLAMVDPDWNRWTPHYQELMASLAQSTNQVILGGTHLTADGPVLYNTAYLFLPSGAVHTQAKVHLTPIEVDPWRLGRADSLSVADTPAGRVAVLVCFDVEFPGAAEAVAEAGADILLVPSATDDRQGFWRVRHCCHARAVENQVYVVHSALVGGLPDVRWLEQSYGKSAILTPCDLPFPPGGIMAEGEWNQNLCVVADADLGLLEQVRSGGSVLPRRERRPGAYRVR